MSKPAQKSERYQERRTLAVDAAARVFAANGFHGASTSAIAAELGIKQGSLYYYFSSKEAALEAVCLDGLSRYVERIEGELCRTGSVAENLYGVIRSHLESYAGDDDALRVHNTERLYLPVARRKKLKSLGTKHRQALQGLFAQGIESGEVRLGIDPKFAAQSVIAVCNAFGEHVFRRLTRDRDLLARQCTDLLLHGLTIEQ